MSHWNCHVTLKKKQQKKNEYLLIWAIIVNNHVLMVLGFKQKPTVPVEELCTWRCRSNRGYRWSQSHEPPLLGLMLQNAPQAWPCQLPLCRWWSGLECPPPLLKHTCFVSAINPSQIRWSLWHWSTIVGVCCKWSLHLVCLVTCISPVLLSPGPSALTLPASWEGSTLTLKGLMGISW